MGEWTITYLNLKSTLSGRNFPVFKHLETRIRICFIYQFKHESIIIEMYYYLFYLNTLSQVE